MLLFFVILIGGAFLVVASFAVMGMLLEFFDNVALIKKKICGDVPVPSSVPMSADATAPSPAPASPSLTGWYCTKCGSYNSNDCNFCVKCGIKRS